MFFPCLIIFLAFYKFLLLTDHRLRSSPSSRRTISSSSSYDFPEFQSNRLVFPRLCNAVLYQILNNYLHRTVQTSFHSRDLLNNLGIRPPLIKHLHYSMHMAMNSCDPLSHFLSPVR